MAKLVKNNSYVSSSKSRLGKNSQVFKNGDLVSVVGTVVQPAGTTWRVDGVCNGTATMASDNESVGLVKVSYTIALPNITEIELEVSGGTITGADVGKYFSLTDKDTVDGTTESSSPVGMQLKMVEFISATKCVFVTIDTEINTIA